MTLRNLEVNGHFFVLFGLLLVFFLQVGDLLPHLVKLLLQVLVLID